MSGFITSLPMYDWPEVQGETDRAWVAIRDDLRNAGVAAPEALTRDGMGLSALWRHPKLLLAQTCWGPMEQGLAEHVTVVGQPDYSAYEGGEGEFYSSAIVMREASSWPSWKDRQRLRFAFNSRDSMSGLIAVERDLAASGKTLDVFSEFVETGSHRASIIAVAEGRADVCAVDCRTWDMAKRFEPAAGALHVVGWTAKRKGLPFVTSRHTPAGVVDIVREVVGGVLRRQ